MFTICGHILLLARCSLIGCSHAVTNHVIRAWLEWHFVWCCSDGIAPGPLSCHVTVQLPHRAFQLGLGGTLALTTVAERTQANALFDCCRTVIVVSSLTRGMLDFPRFSVLCSSRKRGREEVNSEMTWIAQHRYATFLLLEHHHLQRLELCDLSCSNRKWTSEAINHLLDVWCCSLVRGINPSKEIRAQKNRRHASTTRQKLGLTISGVT